MDEEDMERTNCLVTKAMVQTAKAATATRPGGEYSLTQHLRASRPLGAEALAARGPRALGDAVTYSTAGAEPRGPLSPLAEAAGTAFERPSAASKLTRTRAGRRPPLQSSSTQTVDAAGRVPLNG